jgi:hypothetical protein
MTHRASLVRLMADLRRQYTGETMSPGNCEALYGARMLASPDRAVLLAELRQDAFVRLGGADPVPALPERIRAAVLPDAREEPQRAFEAHILRAIARATVHLDHPAAIAGAWLAGRGGRVLWMVRPQPKALTLHVRALALGPLLCELLPRITCEGDLVGVPGLRAVLHRRCVELYVLDTQTRVTLANVSYRKWVSALAFVEALDDKNPLCWLGNDPTPLHPEEAEVQARSASGMKADLLSSMLLRRYNLFSTASRQSVRQLSDNELDFRWQEPPSPTTVAAMLTNPIAGLSGGNLFVAGKGDRLKIGAVDEGWALTLGQLCAADHDNMAARWSAWDREMSRPNPRWPYAITGAGLGCAG